MMPKIDREWKHNLREVEDPVKYRWWNFFAKIVIFSVFVLNTPLNRALFIRSSQIEYLSVC